MGCLCKLCDGEGCNGYDGEYGCRRHGREVAEFRGGAMVLCERMKLRGWSDPPLCVNAVERCEGFRRK